MKRLISLCLKKAHRILFAGVCLLILQTEVLAQCDCPASGSCGPCQGGLTSLTVEFTGGGVIVTITAEDDEGPVSVLNLLSNRVVIENGGLPFVGDVTVTVVGLPGGQVTINTSCDAPVYHGQDLGDFIVLEGTSLGGALCCVPPAITGDNNVCANEQNVAYNTPAEAGHSYNWSVTGGFIDGSATGSSVVIDWGAASAGTLQVTETITATACFVATTTYDVTINANPSTSAITGDNSVCANVTGEPYSVTNTAGSTYAWTITGGTQVSGTNTNSITVNWGASGAGNVQVVETSAVGCVGTAVNLLVTKIAATPTTSAITGDNSVCANVTGEPYSVINTAGSTYAWTITGGTQASGTNTNSITVNWGASGAGNVQVIETSAPGCIGAAVNLGVSKNSNPTTSAITGDNSVCASVTGEPYSVTSTAGSTYAWTITGGTQASGTNTNSITVNWGTSGAGNVQVIETNASGCVGTAVNLAVTKNSNPTTSAITGDNSVCANVTGEPYSVTNTAGSTYAWTITGGTQASGTNTNSITVNWGASGAGNVQVIETSTAGCVGTAVNLAVTKNVNPTTSAITGDNSVCASVTGEPYSVINTAGSTYAWTITGGTQASGTNTNSITVNWGASGAGNVQVIETSAAGCVGTAVNLAVTKNANPSTSAITGDNSVCASVTGEPYSVTNTAGSTYAWTITGGTQASGTNTNSITVNWGASGAGNVRVIETNASGCAGAAVNFGVTKNSNPTTSAITGGNSVCADIIGEPYSVTNTAGSTYAWTITGGTQASGTNTNEITVDWGASGVGNVQVIETNASGCVGTAVNLAVTKNANPTTSAITGDNSVCASVTGEPYSVTSTAGSTYAWTITGGTQASGTNTNSITVNWGTSGAGNVQVIESNVFGCVGTAMNLAVTKNANPTTSAITGDNSVCASVTGEPYSVTSTAGSTYAWTITGGTQASGTNTSSITINWGASGAGNVQVIETSAAGCVGTAVNLAVTKNANPTTSAITGDNSVCANVIGEPYSVINTAGSTYAWTITGGTQASGTNTNSITVDWGASGAGNVQVIETSAAGCVGTAVNLAVTRNANPATSSITGDNSVCASVTGEPYSVTNTAGSTYAWTITGGTQASGTNTNSITVNWGASGAGNVQVIETNASGCIGTAVNLGVTKNSNPTTSAITGDNSVCANVIGEPYSVTNTAGSTYAWTITGGTQASGTNTNSITVNWGPSDPGNVQVVETSAAGCVGTAVNLAVTKNANPATSAITGDNSVCASVTGEPYSVTSTAGSTYAWTITGGAQASGTNTSSITVNWGASGAGNVQVIETNASGCIGTAVNLGVTRNANPTTSAITGDNSVCANVIGEPYSVINTAGSTYAWTITGGTQASGTNTNEITVNWDASGAGNVQVIETSAAGCVGTAVNLGVTKNANPATSAITGDNSVCADMIGEPYSVTNTAGSTYAWTITGGTQASGTNTNSITVNWGASGAGNVQVIETNASGCIGTAVNLGVTKNANPTTSAITGANSVCANVIGEPYSVINTAGSTYAWTITGGTQASGTNTNEITVNWGASGAGNVQMIETNVFGCVGTAMNLGVTKNANPTTSAITGDNSVCANVTGESYSVTNTAGSTYVWTIIGGTQASGTNTNSITVNWGASGAGNVSVTETVDATGCLGNASENITIDPNPTPTIHGDNAVCAGEMGLVYNTMDVVGRTYLWNISGGTITAGAGTNSITVDWGTSTLGNLQLTESITATGCAVTTPEYNVTITNPSLVFTNCTETIYATADSDCKAVVTWDIPSVPASECVTITSTHDPGDTFEGGVTVVTYTASDLAGNESICSFDVIVEDKTAPTISSCQSLDITLPANDDGKAIATWDEITAIDNCDAPLIQLGSHNSGDSFDFGETAVSYQFTDNAGNSSACSFKVKVIDITPPVIINSSSDITASADGLGLAFVNWDPPAVIDNCDSTPTLTSNYAPGTVFQVGKFTVTYTAEDDSGNKSTSEFNIDVVDATAPLIANCPSDITLYADASCNALATWGLPTATDNSDPDPSLTSDHHSGDTFPLGETIVTHTSKDKSGNIATCSFKVIVKDEALPQITCPSNVSTFATASCHESVKWELPAVEDCSAFTFSSSRNPGEAFAIGETEVEYTVTDDHGNESTCSFKVTVLDQVAPVFSDCPGDIELSVTDGCDATTQWREPSVNDNCSVDAVIATHTSGDIFPLGTTEVKYTATDIHGNVSTCSFRVTVKLSTPPVIENCPGDIKVKALESGEVAVQWTEPTAISSCPDVTLTASHRPGDLFSLGKTGVVYTATDRSGNRSECVFNIEVEYEDIEFTIARIVTPDGDGTNDRWILSNIEKFQDNRVVIVDRWGSVVFEAAGYNNENIVWNGDNPGGTGVPTGTYFFTIFVRLGPSQVEKSGFIEVIR